MNRLRIAIDGPAGSGKTTIARLLAQRLGFAQINTGLLYRALAYLALKEHLPVNDRIVLAQRAQNLNISFQPHPEGTRACLDNQDITPYLRQPEVTALTAEISSYPEVRQALFSHQRRLAQHNHIVMEGRDIGTVVLPEAEMKFFLDAHPHTRAQRRYDEMRVAGQPTTFDHVAHELAQRDRQDRTRKVAPLQQAPDAEYIDSTLLNIHEVVDYILNKVKSYQQRMLHEHRDC